MKITVARMYCPLAVGIVPRLSGEIQKAKRPRNQKRNSSSSYSNYFKTQQHWGLVHMRWAEKKQRDEPARRESNFSLERSRASLFCEFHTPSLWARSTIRHHQPADSDDAPGIFNGEGFAAYSNISSERFFRFETARATDSAGNDEFDVTSLCLLMEESSIALQAGR